MSVRVLPPSFGDVSSAVARLHLIASGSCLCSSTYHVSTRAAGARCMRADIDLVFALLESANNMAYELDPESEDEDGIPA